MAGSWLEKMRHQRRLFRLFGASGLRCYRKRGPEQTMLTMRGGAIVHVRPADSDVTTFTQVFVIGDYDLERIGRVPKARAEARYRRILASGKTPVIVDAGANVGAASLWFAQVFPDARIVAIEPDPANARLLRLNVASAERVAVLEAAVAGESGTVAVEDRGAGWATTTIRSETGGIRAITMAEAFGSVPDGTPFLAKIDIEGFESDLFAGDVDWLDETAVVFIEPHDWLFPGRRTSGSFQAAMGARNFELFIVGENLVYVAPGG